jgi:hypothetical protein
LISLQFADPNQEVFLEYWDWMLMETTYDQATVELVDADNQLVGTLVADTAGDYDWTKRVFDLSPYIGQTVKVRFRLISDGLCRTRWLVYRRGTRQRCRTDSDRADGREPLR